MNGLDYFCEDRPGRGHIQGALGSTIVHPPRGALPRPPHYLGAGGLGLLEDGPQGGSPSVAANGLIWESFGSHPRRAEESEEEKGEKGRDEDDDRQ